MPSFDLYKQMYGSRTQGQVRKDDSDMIMNATWWEDIDSRVGYLYDIFHDDQFNVEFDLHSEKSKTKIPVDVKLIQSTYNSLAQDEQSHHIAFRPNYTPNVDYYDATFRKYGNARFPIGLYIDLPDEKGKYRRWLIVDNYTEYSNQFPSYEVLPIDWRLQWVFKNVKHECWGVLRSQSSYNSGVWLSYKTERQENQKKMTLPTNSITETLFYNQRVSLSSFVDGHEPIVWRVSKVEDISPVGINKITFYQDNWDQNNDYIERDDNGQIIGIWCDYFESNIEPTTPTEPTTSVYSIISYSGSKPELKTGGNYKKLTVTFYDDGGVIDPIDGVWTFTIDGEDAAELLSVQTQADYSSLDQNQIRIKFIGDDSYIGKNLVVTHETPNKVKSELTMNIVGL